MTAFIRRRLPSVYLFQVRNIDIVHITGTKPLDSYLRQIRIEPTGWGSPTRETRADVR